MKYVVFDGYNGEQIIIFPKKIQHSHFAKSITELSFNTMRPISGGFIVNGECVGKSESLRMESRGDKDTELIINTLNLDSETTEEYRITPKPAVSKNKAMRLRKARK